MTETIYRSGFFGKDRYGERLLTLDEYNQFKDQLPYPFEDVFYRIGVVAFHILLPIIPLHTVIYVEFLRDKNNNNVHVLDKKSYYTNYSLKRGIVRTNQYKNYLKLLPDWNAIESRTAFYFSPTLLPLMLIHKLIKVIRDKKSHKEVPHANGS
jgi:hypothetical protein